MLEKFYDYLLLQGLEKISIEGYRKILSKFVKDLDTKEPTKEQAEGYLLNILKKDYSYSHIKNSGTIISRYMDFMGRPIEFKKPRKPQELPIKEILTEGEVARMMAACENSRESAMIALLAYCGLRSKEISRLRTEHIDFENGLVRVIGGKFKKDRLVPVSKEGIKIVEKYLRDHPRNSPLFTTLRENKLYNGWALRKMIKKVGRNARIKKRVYPHLMRHTFITHLLEGGANIIAVQQFAGHSDIRTTMRYSHFSPKKLNQEYHYYIPSYQ